MGFSVPQWSAMSEEGGSRYSLSIWKVLYRSWVVLMGFTHIGLSDALGNLIPSK